MVPIVTFVTTNTISVCVMKGFITLFAIFINAVVTFSFFILVFNVCGEFIIRHIRTTSVIPFIAFITTDSHGLFVYIWDIYMWAFSKFIIYVIWCCGVPLFTAKIAWCTKAMGGKGTHILGVKKKRKKKRPSCLWKTFCGKHSHSFQTSRWYKNKASARS